MLLNLFNILNIFCIKKEDKVILSNMKVRISATIDENTSRIIDEEMKKGVYRNKSHVIEEAIKLLKEKKK